MNLTQPVSKINIFVLDYFKRQLYLDTTYVYCSTVAAWIPDSWIPDLLKYRTNFVPVFEFAMIWFPDRFDQTVFCALITSLEFKWLFKYQTNIWTTFDGLKAIRNLCSLVVVVRYSNWPVFKRPVLTKMRDLNTGLVQYLSCICTIIFNDFNLNLQKLLKSNKDVTPRKSEPMGSEVITSQFIQSTTIRPSNYQLTTKDYQATPHLKTSTLNSVQTYSPTKSSTQIDATLERPVT